VNDHPIRAEPVAALGEAMREEGLFHLHEDFASIRECRVNALCLGVAVD
jgi:hypothetical protein